MSNLTVFSINDVQNTLNNMKSIEQKLSRIMILCRQHGHPAFDDIGARIAFEKIENFDGETEVFTITGSGYSNTYRKNEYVAVNVPFAWLNLDDLDEVVEQRCIEETANALIAFRKKEQDEKDLHERVERATLKRLQEKYGNT